MSHHHILQNGSDIRGIAIATDEYAVNLTPQATKEVVRALFIGSLRSLNWRRPIKKAN